MPVGTQSMRSYKALAVRQSRRTLLLLMTVATQALLALMGCNLMAFTFLTARHNSFVLERYLNELI